MEKYETPDLPAKLTWLSLWENMQVAKNKQAIAVQNRFIVLKNKVKGLGVSMRSCCEKRYSHDRTYNILPCVSSLQI